MEETLTEQRRVKDEGLRVVNFCGVPRMICLGNEIYLTSILESND